MLYHSCITQKGALRDDRSGSMVKGFLLVLVAYVAVGVAAVGTGAVLGDQPPIVVMAAADVAATVVVFIFSVIAGNSSVYDPYWSVAPVPIAFYLLSQS